MNARSGWNVWGKNVWGRNSVKRISEILDNSESRNSRYHQFLGNNATSRKLERIARRTAWNKPIMMPSKNGECARLRLGSSFADVGRYLDFLPASAWPFQHADFTHLFPR
jgi:hypothetical protein